MSVSLEKGLSQENLRTRSHYIGGSDANILLNGTDRDVLNLYLEKIGEIKPDDLSWVLPVQMGVQSEPLNVKWFEHFSGHKVEVDDTPRVDKTYPFRRATLDGWLPGVEAVLECKHVNQFAKIEEVTAKYQPQLHHNMAVCGVKKAFLSVFIGTMKHEIVEVDLDPFYAATLLQRELNFWKCVVEKTPPNTSDAVAAPVDPNQLREADMTGNNEWASAAADWVEHKPNAKKFEDAKKTLNGLVEADVGLAYGHGVQIKRAKNNSLRIGVEK